MGAKLLRISAAVKSPLKNCTAPKGSEDNRKVIGRPYLATGRPIFNVSDTQKAPIKGALILYLA